MNEREFVLRVLSTDNAIIHYGKLNHGVVSAKELYKHIINHTEGDDLKEKQSAQKAKIDTLIKEISVIENIDVLKSYTIKMLNDLDK